MLALVEQLAEEGELWRACAGSRAGASRERGALAAIVRT